MLQSTVFVSTRIGKGSQDETTGLTFVSNQRGTTLHFCQDQKEAPISMLGEALVGIEAALLHATPIYYGFGAPPGNGSAVVVIPAFLGTDLYLMEMYAWLRRIGYRPYFSGIGLNAECPNILIQRLRGTIDRARKETGGRVHLIGHSLGGVIARAFAAQRPRDVESVITLGSPIRGTVCHVGILRAAGIVRDLIKRQHGDDVLPNCYTGRCRCEFVESLRQDLASGIDQTAIFTQNDGIVDWRYCITEDAEIDVEVSGTHIGLVFNSTVYGIVAKRLAASAARGTKR